MRVGFVECSDVARSPMAVFANLAGLPHLSNRRLDWPIVMASHYADQLMHAVQFCLHERLGPFADVTGHTIDVCMRRCLVRSELRFHRHVTDLPAELN